MTNRLLLICSVDVMNKFIATFVQHCCVLCDLTECVDCFHSLTRVQTHCLVCLSNMVNVIDMTAIGGVQTLNHMWLSFSQLTSTRAGECHKVRSSCLNVAHADTLLLF